MARYKAGDRVRMRRTSEYYRQCQVGFLDMTRNAEGAPTDGAVIKVFTERERWNDGRDQYFEYVVQWDSGHSDNYRDIDIDLVSSEDGLRFELHIDSHKVFEYIQSTRIPGENDTDYLKRMLGISDQEAVEIKPAIRHLDLDD